MKHLFYLSCFLLVLFLISSSAISASIADISRSFDSRIDKKEAGMLVSIDDSGSAVVADISNAGRLIGVLVEENSSVVEINPSSTMIQVATNGKARTIVSDINGDIKEGDLLVVSNISGVAAKAGISSSKILGIAQQDFNNQSSTAKVQELSDVNDNNISVNIGTIDVIISIGGSSQNVNTSRHSGLFGWFEMLAGKPVSTIRLALSTIISITSILVMFVMVYSATKSTIYGVSRNPLVKNTIFEAFAKVIFTVVCIAVISVLIIYSILKV